MSIPTVKRRNEETWQGTKALFLFCLLLFYLLGGSQLQSFHQLIHSHSDSAMHSAEQEKDPCHRSIYHQDKQKECGHHSHFVAANKCELCDLICHSDPALLSLIFYSSIKFPDAVVIYNSSEAVSTIRINLPSRAPPIS